MDLGSIPDGSCHATDFLSYKTQMQENCRTSGTQAVVCANYTQSRGKSYGNWDWGIAKKIIACRM